MEEIIRLPMRYQQLSNYIGKNINISAKIKLYRHLRKFSIQKRTHPDGESCYPPMYGGDGGTCYSMLSSWH